MIKQIDGFDNYFVDINGNVYSNKSGNFKKLKPRLKNGYYFTRIIDNTGKQKYTGIHRLVALTFIPIDNASKYEVNHKNKIRTDNRLENLEWLSHTDNVRYSRKQSCRLIFDNGIIENFTHISDMNRKYKWTINYRYYINKHNGYSSIHNARIVINEM
jgi:uncharacterized HNH endonuclease L247